jgi:hypothetical protein
VCNLEIVFKKHLRRRGFWQKFELPRIFNRLNLWEKSHQKLNFDNNLLTVSFHLIFYFQRYPKTRMKPELKLSMLEIGNNTALQLKTVLEK